MVKFRKQVKTSIKMSLVLLLVIVFVVLGLYLSSQNIISANDHVKSFISGAQVGMLIGIGMVLLWITYESYRSLKSEERLEAHYIKEHDERNRMIMEKATSQGLNFVLLLLGFASIVAGFYHEAVFFTLFITMAIVAFTKFIFIIYYQRKY